LQQSNHSKLGIKRWKTVR